MRDFGMAMGEIRRTLNQIYLFEVFLSGLLLFLGCYLVLLLFNLRGVYAAIPAIIFILISSYRRLTTNKARIVEGKYAPLREKLRTAADYMGKENPLVEELEAEVLREMKNVSVSQFLNARGLSYKILVVTILSFGIIFSSTLNIHFANLNELGLFSGDDSDRRKSQGAGDFESVQLISDDKIYGDDEVAQLGSEELDIKIKPVDFKVSVKEEGDLNVGTFNDIFPKDAYLKEGEEAQENIPKEQQELVKNYFKQVAQS